jgi:calcineurin-like phosphoesterase family protein
MSTYVISDTHFNHTNIIKYCDRPFRDTNHMNEIMILNWNNLVKPNDTVIHCGDFSFGNAEMAIPIMQRLNGFKTLLRGNHDHKKFWKAYAELENVLLAEYTYRHVGEYVVWFSHYPDDVNLKGTPKHTKKFRSGVDIHVHGHIHNHVVKDPDPRKINVSVEVINYTPVLLETLIENHVKASGLYNIDATGRNSQSESAEQSIPPY